jgi:L-threonylcarbamoyladenylate synthase
MAALSQHSAVTTLKHDGIIAHQTDTIFGLACLPKQKTLSRLSKIKNRPSNKAFILLASNIEQVEPYIALSEKIENILMTPTESPTTWLIDPAVNISGHMLGETDKVAVRITQYQPIVNLCGHVGAIASTSANISNQAVCTNPSQIRQMFGPNIDYVDQNQNPGTGKSSTIIDLSSSKIIRR